MRVSFVSFFFGLWAYPTLLGMEVSRKEALHPLYNQILLGKQLEYLDLQALMKNGDGDFKDTINAQDENGDTLMHLAVQYGSLPTVILLHRIGADLSALNNQGLTPLALAVKIGNGDAKMFLSSLQGTQTTAKVAP